MYLRRNSTVTLKAGQTARLETPTPKPGLHPQKRMLSIWWGVKGVIYWDLLSEKTTVKAYICTMLN